MNKVILVGNLTKDPVLRTTQTGVSVCSFSIAVQRRFANAQGVREADFFDCTAWRQTADFVSRYFTKGRKIGVVGSIQNRSYEAKDGTKRTVSEIQVDEAEFVDSKNSAQQDGTAANTGYGQAPVRTQSSPASEPAGQGFTQVDDDDLPF